jgi:hypothetical protein
VSLFSRYLRHAVPGTTGANGIVAANNPWGAGRATALRNNAQHLVEVNYRRTLWNDPGVVDFYRASASANPVAPSLWTDPPGLWDIRWRYTAKTGGLALDLGTHYVWRTPTGRWPRLVVRFQLKVAATYTAGILLAAAPGQEGPLDAIGVASGAYTDTTFTEQELGLNLESDCVARRAFAGADGTAAPVIDDRGDLYLFRAFLGGYCSSDSGSDPASIVGITLSLETPT